MYSKDLKITRRKWLYIPIETKVRELIAKALFSFVATESGYGVVIGRKSAIRKNSYLPPGMFIEKSISPVCKQSIITANERGHKVSAWCEEGLCYPSADEYGHRKIDKASFDLIEQFYSWGEKHTQDMTEEIGLDNKKIIISGNPRIDLLRPEFRGIFMNEAAALKKNHGPYILINTKFPRYNNYRGQEALLKRMRKSGRIRTDHFETYAKDLIEYQGAVFKKFVEMIEALSSRYPQNKIIIRPHPAENRDVWKSVTEKLSNVESICEGNVAKWILASEISIHSNCTTGVEAYLLGKTPVSYRPICDERFDSVLANAVSYEAFDLDTLLEIVDASLSAREIPDNRNDTSRKQVANHYIANIEGKLASESIIESLSSIDIPENELSVSVERRSTTIGSAVIKDVRNILRPVKHFIFSPKNISDPKQGSISQKYVGISLSEIVAILEAMQKTSNRFNGVKITLLEENLFCIYS